MRLAPGEQAGAASATMNALRQSGMTLGIALLGVLMSERAVGLFSRAASELGVAQADTVARAAITEHVFPQQGATLQALFVPALEGGFQLAMLLAGLACLLALGLLLRLPVLQPAHAAPPSA
ncbi:Uncharacterised protein [Bordetella trematum]|nr:Uncharacterised protein [Bordetella trematum]